MPLAERLGAAPERGTGSGAPWPTRSPPAWASCSASACRSGAAPWSGSANLTRGLRGNVEQYEELRFGVLSEDADVQQARFEALWEYGAPLGELRRSGDWHDSIERAKTRRRLEQDDRRRLARLNACTGWLLGQPARMDTRRAPGYLGITHPDWWDLQLLLRADRALFWRRNTNDFKALAHGALWCRGSWPAHGRRLVTPVVDGELDLVGRAAMHDGGHVTGVGRSEVDDPSSA